MSQFQSTNLFKEIFVYMLLSKAKSLIGYNDFYYSCIWGINIYSVLYKKDTKWNSIFQDVVKSHAINWPIKLKWFCDEGIKVALLILSCIVENLNDFFPGRTRICFA